MQTDLHTEIKKYIDSMARQGGLARFQNLEKIATFLTDAGWVSLTLDKEEKEREKEEVLRFKMPISVSFMGSVIDTISYHFNKATVFQERDFLVVMGTRKKEIDRDERR